MKKLLFLIVFAPMVACTDNAEEQVANGPTEESMMTSITNLEDSLKALVVTNETATLSNSMRIDYVNRLKAFYNAYPDAEKAPVILDKIHMTYSGMGKHELAAAYGDTLLDRFESYENRPMLLESQAVNYDMFITPRDSSKVRHYYTLLLKEDPSMDEDKKEGIHLRLANNHLTMDEFIEKRMAENQLP